MKASKPVATTKPAPDYNAWRNHLVALPRTKRAALLDSMEEVLRLRPADTTLQCMAAIGRSVANVYA